MTDNLIVLLAVSFGSAPVPASKIPPDMPCPWQGCLVVVFSVLYAAKICVSSVKAESLKSTDNKLRSPDIHIKLEASHAYSLGFTAAEGTESIRKLG